MKTLMFLFLFYFSFSFTECKNKPCFTDRAVSEKITDMELTSSVNGDLILFLHKANGSRFSVCNSESFDLKDSTSYIVSGLVYEIKPNERWPGTPFEITAIKN